MGRQDGNLGQASALRFRTGALTAHAATSFAYIVNPAEVTALSLLARLAPHLPYIRRYARALTGDQTTGDHYVRVALEAIASGDRTLDAGVSPRVALYRVFHTIWG